MSSWIPSLFNPSSDDEDEANPTSPTPRSPSSGVKEDLSAVFRGVASFLAPPPTSFSPSSSSSDAIVGFKNDLAEIQGSLKSGFSLFSSKLTSNFLQFQNQEYNDDEDDDDDDDDSEEEDDGIVGINEEVVGFVTKITERPELWTDFPLSLPNDFELSDYQKEHAATIDDLVPEIVTLRQNISSQINDGKFWLIYFILLFPRLNEEDLKLLSTPEIVEARETLLKKLQNKSDVADEASENPESSTRDAETTSQNKDASKTAIVTTNTGHQSNEEVDTSKGIGASQQPENKETSEDPESSDSDKETTSQNKDVSETAVSTNKSGHQSYEEVDTSTSVDAPQQLENEEVSFSDLEDDENDLSGLKGSKHNSVSQGESPEWVRLKEAASAKQRSDKESEGEDSPNDWLTVDDTDFDSLAEI